MLLVPEKLIFIILSLIILVEFHIDKIYENYNSGKIHNFLLENGFTLQKKFSFPFPFTTWEDRLYKNSKFLN